MNQRYKRPSFKWRLGALFILNWLILALSVPLTVQAGALRTEVVTAYNLIVDSNVTSPSTKAPRAAYLGVRIWNDGTTAATNVYAYIGNFTNNTPGVYPARTNPPPLTGVMSLTHVGGSAGLADATRYIGTIQPGQYVAVYWLVTYPNLDNNGVPTWGTSVKPDDDLWLQWDVWTRGIIGGVRYTNMVSRHVTMRNEISAMANKIYPNTANEVPAQYKQLLNQTYPLWQTSFSSVHPGTIVEAQGFWYNLGNVGQGFDNNGDLIPDQNAWMQPVGDASLFDPAYFRLVKTHALVIINLKSGGTKVIQADDQLYFENVPDNTDAFGWVGYEFQAINGPASVALTPYQEVASGFDNEKFNGDYGSGVTILTSSAAQVGLTKTASLTNATPGARIDYLMSYTNSGASPLGSPNLGTPLVVQDHIPPGMIYVTNSALVSNTLPAGVTSYTVLFSTNNGSSWSSSQPPTNTVTDIQWWLSDAMPTNTAGIVGLSMTVSNPYTFFCPVITNTAGLSFGNDIPFTNSSVKTLVRGTNQLGDHVFLDNGAGGGYFGNALQDGTEPGISNVTVSLYFDCNSNGVVDAGEPLVLSTVTDVNGYYLFTNLADGNYNAVVNVNSPGLPAGVTPTTPTLYFAGLDPNGTNANTVSYLNADFGFAPALQLTKTLTSPTVYEGQTVSYSITVTNKLPGDGTGLGTNIFYGWATNGTTGSGQVGWNNPTLAYTPPYPDGLGAHAPFQGTLETLTLYAFGFASVRAGNLTNVQIVIPTIFSNLNAGNGSTIEVLLYSNAVGNVVFDRTWQVITNFPIGATNWIIDVSTNRSWQWSDLANTNFQVQITSRKNSSGPGDLWVDEVGFKVTSDTYSGGGNTNTTMNPVPLTDQYPTNLLRYVSAYPSPDSTGTTNGLGMLQWNNLGPVYPGGGRQITVNFLTLQPPTNMTTSFTNTAYISNAFFINGLSTGPATASVVTNDLPSGSISGLVWRDLNGDGLTNNEQVIPYVMVTLSNSVSLVTLTNYTDVSGNYLFTTLTNTGTYYVRVYTNTLPSTLIARTYDYDGTNTPDIATITTFNPSSTTGADTITNVNFGYSLSAMIDGYVWNDLDRDGDAGIESNEPRFSGVTVLLYSNNVQVATTTTDTNGFFKFSGNFSGSYTVVVTNSTGALSSGTWVESYDTDGLSTTNKVTVTAVANSVVEADFSYYQSGTLSIGDTVYYDWNGNGIQNTNEEGIPNIPVYLYSDVNSNGVLDTSDQLMLTATTSSSGTYLFTNLPAGYYLVQVGEGATNFPTHVVMTQNPNESGVCVACNGYATVQLTTTNNLNIDFGYLPYGYGVIGDTVWRDLNGNGIQDGAFEVGISNVQVTLLADLNNDGTYVVISNKVTNVNGQYLFTGLPDGNYRVQVSTADTNLPTDSYGVRWGPTTTTNISVTISNGSTYLGADFGFNAYCAIGDTIFWDANGNGTMDTVETGISNITVSLYYDVNSNGVYDAGDVYVGAKVTSTNGLYVFTGLVASNYVVVVSKTGSIASATLTADPTVDGQVCTNGMAGCDNQVGVTLAPGVSFMGADFGYQPPGVIGDTVWLDSNNDGIQESGEPGLAYVSVYLYDNAGHLVATNMTDSTGLYLFSNLTNGTYKVQVITNTGALVPAMIPTYDYDGTNTANYSMVTITNGETRLDQDFGYRYFGANSLSGTIGLDAAPYDGVMGTNGFSIRTNEVAYANVSVYMYLWTDANANGVVDSGETVYLQSTTTATNGNYSFTNLPTGAGNYVVSMDTPYPHLILTTTNGATPATNVVVSTNSFGETLSAYQVVPSTQTVTTNVDFAFMSSVNYDFGDLPDTYSTLLTSDGPRHVVPAVPNLYLGAGVSYEADGQPAAAANLDTYDDGVTNLGLWFDGSNGTKFSVKVGAGSGWLVGWIDYNHSGTFDSTNEMVVSQAVSTNGTGLYFFTNTVPAGSISSNSTTTVYARFRLFSSAPSVPALAYTGSADNGEVEDYRWILGSIGNRVWLDINNDGIQEPGEPGLANVRVYVDLNGNGAYDAGEPAATTDATGTYYIGGFSPGTYTVRVDTSTLPSGVSPCYDLDGVGTPNVTTVTMTDGQTRTDVNFAYRGNASVGDYTWVDTNGNGAQDSGEPALTNITVVLYQTNVGVGTLTALSTNLSGTNGIYGFSGLQAGTYMVAFGLPSGYNFTSAYQGGNTNFDSNVERVQSGFGYTAPFALANSQAVTNMDAGYYQPVTIGDYTWLDINGNGIQDTGEPALGSVTNVLYQTNITTHVMTAIATNVSSGSGYYLFTNLPPGTYQIQFIAPAGGYTHTPALQGSNTNKDSNADATNGYSALLTYVSGTTDLSIDAGFKANPTAATGVSLSAYLNQGQAWVTWQTYSELGLMAFDLTRTPGGTTQAVDVTPDWVFANGQDIGATYTVPDTGAIIPGSYTYDLYGYYTDGSRHLLASAVTQLGATASVAQANVQIQGFNLSSGGAVLHWSGGSGPYVIEESSTLGADADWHAVGWSANGSEVQVPFTNHVGFFRIRDTGN